MEILNYPYFIWSFFLFFIAILATVLLPDYRKELLLSGFLSVPCCFTSIFFVPEYWSPVRVFSFFVGVEDIIFSFSTGLIVWVPVTLFHKYSHAAGQLKKICYRYILVCVLGLTIIFLMRQTQIMVMNQALIGIAIAGVIIGWNNQRVIPIAFLMGVTFCSIYSVLLFISLNIFPTLIDHWTHSNLSGIIVIGIPVEEVFWAFAFGMCWVIVMSYVFQLQFKSKKPKFTHSVSDIY